MLLVPAYDPLEQSVEPCSKWTLKRTFALGAWKWVKDTATSHEDDFKTPSDAAVDKAQDLKFDQATFDQKLRSEGWTFEESTYLVDLCTQFEQRFIVVADRYNYSQRSLPEIKHRYYEIMEKLNNNNHGIFDAEAEKNRIMAEELFESRTKEQIIEEQQLLRIARNVQGNLQKLWKRRQEIIATVAGDTFLMNSPGLPDILGLTTDQVLKDYQDVLVDSTATPQQPARDKKKKKIKRAVPSEAGPTKQHQSTAAAAAVSSSTSSTPITPMLRSACLKPIKAGLARQVDKYMATELNLPLRPTYPSERNCALYDQIRAIIADIIEQSKKSAK